MSLWGGRFQDGSSAMFRTVNDSLPFDRVLASQDIRCLLYTSPSPRD